MKEKLGSDDGKMMGCIGCTENDTVLLYISHRNAPNGTKCTNPQRLEREDVEPSER